MIKKALSLSPNKTKFSPLFFSGDIINGIKMTKKLGFEGVEISINDPATINSDEIIECLKKNKLKVSTIATGQSYIEDGLYLCSTDDDIRKKTIKRLKKQIEFAAKVNAKLIIGGIRGKSDQPIDELLMNKLKESVYQCCVYAEKLGVGIIIEPVNHYEVSCIHTIEQAVNFVKDINHKALSILYDTYHANIEERSMIEPLLSTSGFLKHIHFADNNRLVPGFGCLNFNEILRVLNKIGYKEFVCIEALPQPDSYTAAKQAICYLNSIIY